MLKNEHVVCSVSDWSLDPKFDPFGCASCIPGGGVWFAHRRRGWIGVVQLGLSPQSAIYDENFR